MIRCLVVAVAITVLAGCSLTPYRPAVVTRGSAPFPGIGTLMTSGNTVDVVLVHGMCTHDKTWAYEEMQSIAAALDANLRPVEALKPSVLQPSPPKVEVVDRVYEVAGGNIHFYAIIWSGLTTPLKRQLLFDKTGVPNDCSAVDAQSCSPIRASLNGTLKDQLLDDCLADAMIYEGESRGAIRRGMVEALTNIVESSSVSQSPLILVVASLGSKIAFDALTEMLASNAKESKIAGDLVSRLALIFMEANQLPILGLADQDIARTSPTEGSKNDFSLQAQGAGARDPLVRFAHARRQLKISGKFDDLLIVAFTDPNDLLSYRLLSSHYASVGDIKIADILVSNQPTYFTFLENPLDAHTTYGKNSDVARFIACGNPAVSRCK